MDVKVDTALIRKLRQDRALSQEELATAAGLSLRTVQRIEAEGVASLESKKALAAVFGIDAIQLNAPATRDAGVPAPAGTGSAPGLLLTAFAQLLCGLFSVALGIALFEISIALHWGFDSEHTLTYFGAGAVAIGAALAVSAYGVLRARAWARALALWLNAVNIPFLIVLFAVEMPLQQQHLHNTPPLWLELAGPLLSFAVLALLLRPRIAQAFARPLAA